jgi:hypothetical protein
LQLLLSFLLLEFLLLGFGSLFSQLGCSLCYLFQFLVSFLLHLFFSSGESLLRSFPLEGVAFLLLVLCFFVLP